MMYLKSPLQSSYASTKLVGEVKTRDGVADTTVRGRHDRILGWSVPGTKTAQSIFERPSLFEIEKSEVNQFRVQTCPLKA